MPRQQANGSIKGHGEAFARAKEEGSGALPRCEVGWALVRTTLKRLEKRGLLSYPETWVRELAWSFRFFVVCIVNQVNDMRERESL